MTDALEAAIQTRREELQQLAAQPHGKDELHSLLQKYLGDKPIETSTLLIDEIIMNEFKH